MVEEEVAVAVAPAVGAGAAPDGRFLANDGEAERLHERIMLCPARSLAPLGRKAPLGRERVSLCFAPLSASATGFTRSTSTNLVSTPS